MCATSPSAGAWRTFAGWPHPQLANSFAELDPGGTGNISTDQVGVLLEKLSLNLNPEQLSRAKQQLDVKHTGAVAYRDFVAWWRG